MGNLKLDWKTYVDTSNKAVEEGCVLLRNENQTLPLASKSKIAVFGRMQKNYYKSGTGSGGMVNVAHVVSVSEALHEETDFLIDVELEKIYEEWEEHNLFNYGEGWGTEPWSQEEMEVSKELASDMAKRNDAAVVIVARTAGEDQDNKLVEGSFLLTDKEMAMIKTVSEAFEKTIVLLNTGNIIDMSFEDVASPSAVMYIWQGGMIGGTAVAKILSGEVNPSGKIPDTIAIKNEDYIAGKNFGEELRNFYQEDIFVGYRYFETFEKEKVRYPFGFGLSYTTFSMMLQCWKVENQVVNFQVEVKNTGSVKGKEVVQAYVKAPSGKLGKAARSLIAFQKTEELNASQTQVLTFDVPFSYLASFDDSGITGNKDSFVLEEGTYEIFIGSDVRRATSMFSFELSELLVLSKVVHALYPDRAFERMVAVEKDGQYFQEWEQVPLCDDTQGTHQKNEKLHDIELSDDRKNEIKNATLQDVIEDVITMEEFIGTLTDRELMTLVCGEGMGSPKVTAGTAAAFGGVCESLKAKKVPCGCCADGPSGIRLESGSQAMSLPNGTLLASTFNTDLTGELFEFVGVELIKNEVDILLGPGINIHRYPLNGRNFEYFSEDPLLTGKMAVAQILALQKNGVTGALKHFCCNNQEAFRHNSDSVVSARALREIYLRAFEMSVKEANACAIMTTYGSLNGAWTAGNYDLNLKVLREDWNFRGFTMTDWWAKVNEEGQPADRMNFASMVKACNDVYMVVPDAELIESLGNLPEKMESGELSRAVLERSAFNVLNFLKETHAMQRMMGIQTTIDESNLDITEGTQEDGIELGTFPMDDTLTIPFDELETTKGKIYVFNVLFKTIGTYEIKMTASSEQSELAQMAVTLFQSNVPIGVFSYHGSGGVDQTLTKKTHNVTMNSQYKVMIRQGGLDLKKMEIRFLSKENLLV